MANRSPLIFAPPLIFLAIAGLFYIGMQRDDPDALPSAFAGQFAPPVSAEPLADYAQLSNADLKSGEISIVNFWASWCPPCRAEHPTLHALSEEGITVYGVNFKDTADQAGAYLEEEGNPFSALSFDPAGRMAIDWGVAAPPETFIIDGEGRVLYKFIGPLVGSDYRQRFRPELEKALTEAGTQ